MLTRTPKQGYLAACGALKRVDLRPYLGAIEVPTLCLVGDEDGSTPVALVRKRPRSSKARALKSSRAPVICQISSSRDVARLVAEHAARRPEAQHLGARMVGADRPGVKGAKTPPFPCEP